MSKYELGKQETLARLCEEKDATILECKAEIERLNSGWQTANHRALELGLELDRLKGLIK
jgi:hypothetical protein